MVNDEVPTTNAAACSNISVGTIQKYLKIYKQRGTIE